MTPEICHGHYVKKAAYDQLSTDLAEALAVIGEMEEGYRSRCNYCHGELEGCKLAANIPGACRAPRARALLSKHEKGS